MATVICGVNEVSNDSFHGKTIDQLVREAGYLLNIPENPTILVNDHEVSDRATIVRAGDRIEFVKAAGMKG